MVLNRIEKYYRLLGGPEKRFFYEKYGTFNPIARIDEELNLDLENVVDWEAHIYESHAKGLGDHSNTTVHNYWVRAKHENLPLKGLFYYCHIHGMGETIHSSEVGKEVSKEAYSQIRYELKQISADSVYIREKCMESLRHPNTPLEKYYTDSEWITHTQEYLKELLLSELKEETRRFKGFRNMVNDYAKNNNIDVIWKGTFPLLTKSEREAFFSSIKWESPYSNPFHPYFYKEVKGIRIYKDAHKEISTLIHSISCDVSGKVFKILAENNESAKTIPINPLETKDWHLNHLQEVIEWLIISNSFIFH